MDDTIPYGIRTRVAAIAREFSAVQYDRHDPHAAAIEAAADLAGIQAVPADLTPRMMRGAVAQGGPTRDVAVLAAGLHQLLCTVTGAVSEHACIEDTALATDLADALSERGWRLANDVRTVTR